MAETTDEATFEISPYRPYCEAHGCLRIVRWTVRLIGSTGVEYEVCGHHKRWAKLKLVIDDKRQRGLVPRADVECRR
jgi:hypothetical protein